jgi:uridine phosphorylase
MTPLDKKFDSQPILTAEKFLNYLKKNSRFPQTPAPEAVILSYQPQLYSFVKNNHKTQACDRWFKSLLFLNEFENRYAIMGNFGIGAPAAVITLEELIAWGVKKFISIGTAGALSSDLKIGDIALCTKALRNEGASFHYQPEGQFSYPDKNLTACLSRAFSDRSLHYSEVTSWTTDAPYRETEAEVLYYKSQNIQTVEMEASALFAVAQHHKIPIASAFTISDSLHDLNWDPHFLHPKVQDGLEDLFQSAVGSFKD